MPHRHANRARESEGELHTLYRFYGRDDELLYVGITCNPGNRLNSHRRHKAWWRDVTRIALEQFESRVELATAELTAIRAEKPLHNIAGAGPSPPRPSPSGPRTQPEVAPDFYEYDHGEIARWPEYSVVCQAIDALAHRFDNADLGETQEEYEQIFVDLARHMVAGHSCIECRDQHQNFKAYAPHACEEASHNRFALHYVCDLGHEWTMWSAARKRFAGFV